jgi:hypothetical protein
MSARKTLPRLTLAALAAVALAAPSAMAMPAEGNAGAANDPRQMDMHASTVTKPDAAPQDLRGEAAADTSPTPGVQPQTQTRPAAPPSLPPQTWPAYPRAIPASPPAESAPIGDGDGGGGSDAPLLGFLIGAAVVLAGGAVVLTRRTRESTAH